MNAITNWRIVFNDGRELPYNQVFELYYRSLCFFATKIIQDKTAAEDIVTDSFVKLLKVNLNGNHQSELRSYLFAITRNACIDFLRKQKRQKKVFDYFKMESEEESTAINNEMIYAEVLQMVYEEIEHLPTQCRQVFKGIYFEGKGTDLLAKELLISRQTVLNHKSRAIQLIKTALLKKGISDHLTIMVICSLLFSSFSGKF